MSSKGMSKPRYFLKYRTLYDGIALDVYGYFFGLYGSLTLDAPEEERTLVRLWGLVCNIKLF